MTIRNIFNAILQSGIIEAKEVAKSPKFAALCICRNELDDAKNTVLVM